MRHAALIGALCTVFVTACSEETGPNISGVPSLDIVRVTVSPSLDTLFVADTLRPTDRLQMTAASSAASARRYLTRRWRGHRPTPRSRPSPRAAW